MKINLKGVSTGFNPIPAGKYVCKLTEVKEGTSKQGNPMVSTKWVVSEETDDFAGRILFHNFSMLPNALWAFKQAVIALGADPEDLEDEFDPVELMKEYLDQEALLEVTIYTDDNGVAKGNNVKSVADTSSWN